MAKTEKIETEQFNDLEVPTTISIPNRIKEDCKRKGIKFKRCFLIGYHSLASGEVSQTKQNNQEIKELREGNAKLQRKMTELSLKILDLEKKNV